MVKNDDKMRWKANPLTIFHNTQMKEVDKDWELTKIAQSISHNQGSAKSGEGLGDGCHGNLSSFSHTEALNKQGHCMETAEMHTTEWKHFQDAEMKQR